MIGFFQIEEYVLGKLLICRSRQLSIFQKFLNTKQRKQPQNFENWMILEEGDLYHSVKRYEDILNCPKIESDLIELNIALVQMPQKQNSFVTFSTYQSLCTFWPRIEKCNIIFLEVKNNLCTNFKLNQSTFDF